MSIALRSITQVPTPPRFANETPAQLARHREIDLRYRRRRKTFVKIVNLRRAEITAFLDHRYGFILPNNGENRRMARIMFDHLAQLGEDHCRRWAAEHMPWMPEHELDDMVVDAGEGKRWWPVTLGKALGLRNADRIHLDIRTIRPIDRTL